MSILIIPLKTKSNKYSIVPYEYTAIHNKNKKLVIVVVVESKKPLTVMGISCEVSHVSNFRLNRITV